MNKILCLIVSLFLISCGGPAGTNPDAPVVIPDPGTPVTPVTPPEPAHYRGYKKTQSGQPGLISGAPFILADIKGNLPIRWSWKDSGFDIPVKNQKSCGSCWSFSTVENMEWAVKIFLGKEMVLSTQSLLQDFYGCGGGDFDGQSEVDRGLPLESDCPYKANNSKCPSNVKIAAKAVKAFNIGDGTNSPTTTQIKEAVRQFGPQSTDVAATSSWDSYNGGVKQSCGGTQIDHMVVIYGWDDLQGSQGVWLVRNSWGGIDFILPYGCDSIGQDVATVTVK